MKLMRVIFLCNCYGMNLHTHTHTHTHRQKKMFTFLVLPTMNRYPYTILTLKTAVIIFTVCFMMISMRYLYGREISIYNSGFNDVCHYTYHLLYEQSTNNSLHTTKTQWQLHVFYVLPHKYVLFYYKTTSLYFSYTSHNKQDYTYT
jgi:hypothetical protein